MTRFLTTAQRNSVDPSVYADANRSCTHETYAPCDGCLYPWAIELDGEILDRFSTEDLLFDAMQTGDYPDAAEPTFINVGLV